MVWLSALCCLMTPGLGKDIQCHVWPSSFLSQIVKSYSLQMATLIFHRRLCGYAWLNLLTLSLPRYHIVHFCLLKVLKCTAKSHAPLDWSAQEHWLGQYDLLQQQMQPYKLTLKVLNFWEFTSYCSLKPLWSGMGEVVPACTSPTLHPPSPPAVHQLPRLAL